MNIELVKKFIGKRCIIYIDNCEFSAPNGTITAIEDNWLELTDENGRAQLVNLDYAARIQEYPEKKKKNKSKD